MLEADSGEAQDEQAARLERLERWRAAGLDPYATTSSRTHTAAECLAEFENLAASQTAVTVAGRVRAQRLHGGSCFAVIEDASGRIQVYAKRDVVGPELFERFTEWLDVGDFVDATGSLFKTKTGEVTVQLSGLTVLSKALTPLPEKWHGLQDVEQRYRYRYLDLLSNPEVRKVFDSRTKIISYLRRFLDERGFSEVDTPILQAVASGAAARPFKTHHDALDVDMYLRVAPELYLKRLLVGGYERVYEVARCFRNEGIDYAHNPEFTQVELYWAYATYEDLMVLVENLLERLLDEVVGTRSLVVEGHKVSFTAPFERLDFTEAFRRYLEVDIEQLPTAYDVSQLAQGRGLAVDPGWGRGKLLDELYKEYVRPKLIEPTFIINHPVDLSPLAKRIAARPSLTERMQLVVGGRLELCNGFSELNDPLDQLQRFQEQQRLRQAGDVEVMGADLSFVEALKVGMPPAAGLGIGIDRLVALLCEQTNLKDVIMFPTLRPLPEAEQ